MCSPLIKQGSFIVFEGLDTSGKSTLIKLLSEYLQTYNVAHIVTQEPGGTLTGKAIRKLLLNTKLDKYVQLFLFMAARRDNTQNVIIPALKEGYTVISDRYRDSSIAYQGAMGINVPLIKMLNFLVSIKPDITFFMDISMEEMEKRLKLIKTSNHLDEMPLDFYRRVREKYLMLARENNYIILDGHKPPDALLKEVIKHIC